MFVCVWPFCGFGTKRVKTLSKRIKSLENWKISKSWHDQQKFTNYSPRPIFMDSGFSIKYVGKIFRKSKISDSWYQAFEFRGNDLFDIAAIPGTLILRNQFIVSYVFPYVQVFHLLQNDGKTFALLRKLDLNLPLPTQLTFICSKLTIETLEKGMKYVQS